MKASVRTLTFVLSAVATLGAVAPAWADDGWDHHRREREWRQREWRRHHPPPPGYYAAPQVVYAAPPPVVYAAPAGLSATIVLPLRFR